VANNIFSNMDMDVLSALMLGSVGIFVLWVLIVRKRYGSVVQQHTAINYHVETESVRSGVNGLLRAHGVAWTTGRRNYMEDRHVACGVHLEVARDSEVRQKPASLYAVFDGHGGSRAAEFCKENIENTFRETTQTMKEAITEADNQELVEDSKIAKSMLFKAMCELDKNFLKLAQAQSLSDGTTAVIALMHGDQIVVGNIGDSRAVLLTTSDEVIALSEDHKPDRSDERQRIEALGGYVVMKGVFRVMGVLAVSRAIGDMYLKKWVTGMPEMREEHSLKLVGAKCLILASDGLWDVMLNEDIPAMINSVPQTLDGRLDTEAIAKLLSIEACRRHSMDNITVMVVDLLSKSKQE
jgi:protein phosphatase 1L